MYRKPSTVSVSEWTEGYELWLKHGYTLDMVGQHLGLRPKAGRSVSTYLVKHFGVDATNPIANSFIRSLAEDYPNNEWVETLEPCDNRGSGRFIPLSVEKSNAIKGVARLTGNRSNEMRYRIAYQETIHKTYDPWEDMEPKPLLLPLFSLFVGCLIPVLYNLLNIQQDELQTDVV